MWRKKLHRRIWDGRSNKTCFIKPLSVKRRIFGWVDVGDFMRCDALSGFWWAVYTPAVHIQMYSDQTNNLDFNTFYSTTAPVSKVIHGNQMNSPPPSVRRDLSSPFSSYTLHLWGRDNRYSRYINFYSAQLSNCIRYLDVVVTIYSTWCFCLKRGSNGWGGELMMAAAEPNGSLGTPYFEQAKQTLRLWRNF